MLGRGMQSESCAATVFMSTISSESEPSMTGPVRPRKGEYLLKSTLISDIDAPSNQPRPDGHTQDTCLRTTLECCPFTTRYPDTGSIESVLGAGVFVAIHNSPGSSTYLWHRRPTLQLSSSQALQLYCALLSAVATVHLLQGPNRSAVSVLAQYMSAVQRCHLRLRLRDYYHGLSAFLSSKLVHPQ